MPITPIKHYGVMSAFACVHCQVLAQHLKKPLYYSCEHEDPPIGDHYEKYELSVTVCTNCEAEAIWHNEELIFPKIFMPRLPQEADEVDTSSDTVQETEYQTKNLILAVSAVLVQVNEHLESIEQNNFICSEHPDHLADVKTLQEDLTQLINQTSSDQMNTINNEETSSRWKNICRLMASDIALRTSDEAIAQRALPLGIILGCGTIGAIISGPIGFGAGGWVGKLLIGEKKTTDIADKIESAIEDNAPKSD